MNRLNPSIKHHTLIGALISIWGFVFAFFARPFEHGDMDLRIWIYVSVGFGIVSFLSYGLVSLIQKIVYQKVQKWNTGLEIVHLVCFYLLYWVGTYFLYRSSLINGNYEFFEFFIKIILNIVLIFTPILILARRYVIKLIPVKEEYLTIKGENKLDILKIKKHDLICVSNSQNYVEIFFTENNQLKTKLIRISLKKIQYDFDFLVQIHRSHLINPSHFKAWKNQNIISLTHIELPVSKNYKERLL